MLVLRSSSSTSLFEWLVQKRFCLGLTLPQQHEADFVELFSGGHDPDRSNTMLDIAEVCQNFSNAHSSGLVYCRALVNVVLEYLSLVCDLQPSAIIKTTSRKQQVQRRAMRSTRNTDCVRQRCYVQLQRVNWTGKGTDRGKE